MEAAIGSVGDAEGGGFRVSAVDPKSVGEIKLSVSFAGLADGGEVAAGGIVTVNAMAAVAIGEVDAAIARMEGGVGGHEFVATPVPFGGAVFAFGVSARGHGSALIPDDVSGESEFGEGFDVLIAGDVEELFFAFAANFNAMASALELAAEGADEFPFGIEDEDGGVVFDVGFPFVHDVEILLGIDGDIVSGLPGELIRKLGEAVIDFVLVFSFSDGDWAACFFAGGDVWKRKG